MQYSDRLIVLVYVWAVLHDRPVSWACRRCNWPRDGELPLPDESTLSRRMRTPSVLQLLQRLHVSICSLFQLALLLKHMDSFPLPVGSSSHDRDARRGRAAREMARGYKLHAICVDGVLAPWTLAPMNSNDQTPAPHLLQQLCGGGYVTADNGYDANPVHRAAARVGHQLLAPPRRSEREVADTRRRCQRNCPQRLRSLELLNCPLRHAGVPGGFGPHVHRQRIEMEQTLGRLRHLCLGGPPPWVRTPHRVASWIAVKIILLNLNTAARRGELKRLAA